MAVRFDASGEHYTRAITLGSVTDWSACCWAKLAVDRTVASIIWQIDDGSGTSYLRVSAWNGTALAFQTQSSAWFGLMGHTLAADQWVFIGLSATTNPGLARVRIRTAGTATFIGGTPSQSNVTVSANTIRLGNTAASDWFNGSICGVRMWDAALTAEELEKESWTYQPQRTSNLRVWYPLLAPSTVDYSGGGQTLSGGTGAAQDDGPPIAWSTARHRIVIPAALPPVTGDLAGVLPAATATTTGMVRVSGTLIGVAPAAAASLAGDVDTNHLAGILPAATAAMAGTVKVSAAAAGVLPAAAGLFAGEVEIPANDITVTASEPVRGWAAAEGPTWGAGAGRRGWTAGPPTT
ncbi:LamG-like jellyroll fold domain-containing protein [Nonomuraea sp. MTCD27]|uniref:LamG-like jellyroll fold domain-containing protein n=1 Tax=Nonomuraea sp. MTCD27 TaxID=1676747 RepID=UPI0035C0DA76